MDTGIAVSETTVDFILSRAQKAWADEKTYVQQSRQRWLWIGEALAEGRQDHPSNQAFSQWCRENGFGDMARGVRADAIWVFENQYIVHAVYNDLSHPTHIRQAHRKANRPEGASVPPPEVNPTAPESFRKVAALVAHAERGEGVEKEVAQRKIDKISNEALVDMILAELRKQYLTAPKEHLIQFIIKMSER